MTSHNSTEFPDQMRVYLTQSELETETGKELLQLCNEITTDGKIELPEINALRRWLCSHKGDTTIVAIAYLGEIMERMTAALLDRLTHHCEIFEMNSESFRFRESMKEQKKSRKQT